MDFQSTFDRPSRRLSEAYTHASLLATSLSLLRLQARKIRYLSINGKRSSVSLSLQLD